MEADRDRSSRAPRLAVKKGGAGTGGGCGWGAPVPASRRRVVWGTAAAARERISKQLLKCQRRSEEVTKQGTCTRGRPRWLWALFGPHARPPTARMPEVKEDAKPLGLVGDRETCIPITPRDTTDRVKGGPLGSFLWPCRIKRMQPTRRSECRGTKAS